MKARNTQFPNDIDRRTYYSDVSLQNQSLMNDYHSLLQMKKYNEASQTVSKSGVPFYSAELFNFFETCAKNIGEYLLTKSIQGIRPIYQQEAPVGANTNSIWISDEVI